MEASQESPPDLRIGTSGYDYPEWKGVFYPPELPRNDFLAAYAGRFSTLELNFSYYGMPKAASIAALIDRARSPRLDFSIKAHRSLTHEIDPASYKEGAKEFRAGIGPLVRAGRLAAILLEFPFGFAYRPDERRYLEHILAEFEGLPLVVEFRHERRQVLWPLGAFVKFLWAIAAVLIAFATVIPVGLEGRHITTRREIPTDARAGGQALVRAVPHFL
ncbi:MAG: DUF72 domain-containing protein, partial [Spirochaetota bacterium]